MRGVLAAVLLLALTSARAQDRATLAWDCWVDDLSPSVLVRCIHDRCPGSPPSDDMEDEVERLALEHIHQHFHQGDEREASAEARRDVVLLREGRLWTINIHIHPFGPERVEELVRSLLCKQGAPCKVTVKSR